MTFEWLNDTSRKFLDSGYLLEGETAEDRIRQICDSFDQYIGVSGMGDKLWDYCSRGWVSFSSPVWSNYGRPKRGLPVSCYGGTTGDSVAEILYFQAETGILSKVGGGTSGNFGDIRPRGSHITGNGKTGGAVHFMQLFQEATDVISQGGTRKGRMAPYLPIDHGDIDEFLDIMTEGHPIQSMTTGVIVDDDWMQSMIGGDSEKRRVWAKVLRRRKEVGVPYIVFKDNINANKPDVYHHKDMEIKASNLCVAPETAILTEKGHVPIADLVGETVNVWNGSEFSQVVVRQTGSNQNLLTVKTNEGGSIDCTPQHKFHVVVNYNKVEVKEAQDLEKGDKLIRSQYPVIDGSQHLPMAYENGFFSGDGCHHRGKSIVYLYNDKRHLEESMSLNGPRSENADRVTYSNVKGLREKFFVPMDDFSLDSKLSWLAGYLDADGTVCKNGNSYTIQAASVDYNFIHNVRLMLQTLGVDSKVTANKDARLSYMPDGKGGSKQYQCQEIFRLLIATKGVQDLLDMEIPVKRLDIPRQSPNRVATRFLTVDDVVNTGRVDDTFCFTEHKRHLGVFNGILTGQCSEIALPATKDETFVCVLSSVNLEKYDEWKNTDLIKVMTYFLDTVAEETLDKMVAMRDSDSAEERQTFYFLQRAFNFVKKHRALGLGVLGWSSYLQRNMIPFESDEAFGLNVAIHKQIQEQSHEASRELAEMFGEPEVLEGYGRRNTTTMAIAPTTSSAAILGQVSQSIEPWMSNYFIKNLAKMKVEVKNRYLEQLLEQHGRNDQITWDSIAQNDGSVAHLDFLTEHERDVFKTFREIDQSAIIGQAADRQHYLDQTQSLNLMIDSKMTPKEINSLIIDAWKDGICTLYYQHSVNKAQQVFQDDSDCKACEA